MISQLYRKDLNMGGWFSFNSTKEDWKGFYAKRMAEHFFNLNRIEDTFDKVAITEETLITKNLNFSGIKDKRVLVIGAGPSSSELNEEILSSYDYIFSCNHFYRNNFLKNQKIDLILVGDEINLNDTEFINYLKRFKPVVGFEHSSRRASSDIIRFKKINPKAFVYLTRYFSRLGYVARACVLARCMGAAHIDFIGMDGFRNNVHYFEKLKNPPPFNDNEKFREQMKIFCQYMIKDLKVVNFNNLSENSKHSIYGNILSEVKNEKN